MLPPDLKPNHLSLALEIAGLYKTLPQVSGILLGGSVANLCATEGSDIDLYILTTDQIPLQERRRIINDRGALHSNLNLNFWDLGDQWFDKPTGIEVDVIFWDMDWINDQIDRVLVKHQASLGFSTCHWYTIKNASTLYDKNGSISNLISKSNTPYPEGLRDAIIEKNYPVLRNVIPSYANQIKKAIDRKDLVSINHRISVFLSSYFDILFALNRVPHPGEKRLLHLASILCDFVPEGMTNQVIDIISKASRGDEDLIHSVHELIDGLDDLIADLGYSI